MLRRCINMSDEPLITIVIPVRDRAMVVGDTLRSVAAQTLRPLCVVLVDNGSCDRTPEVLRLWAEMLDARGIFTRVVSEPRPGASCARNRGLREVPTPYVMFFDSDDTMSPDHCRNVADGIIAAGYPDIAGWPVRQGHFDGSVSVGRFCSRNLMVNHLFHGCMSTQRFAAKTEFVRSVGAWNECLRGWDDYELGIRMLCATKSVVRLPLKPDTVVMVPQEESITGTAYSHDPAKWEEALDICAELLASGKGHGLLRWIDVRRIILAGEYVREGECALSASLMERVLASAPSAWRRTVYRFLHSYFVKVGRGVSVLARILLYK